MRECVQRLIAAADADEIICLFSIPYYHRLNGFNLSLPFL